MIRLTDVSFTYAGGRENAGVNHLNLEIASGEVVLLCNESGCGKTTVTRMVNGLIPHFYEGELTVGFVANIPPRVCKAFFSIILF